jgi:exopolysaccharide biosynthesis polyprenyl glycosylphosphotransferase
MKPRGPASPPPPLALIGALTRFEGRGASLLRDARAGQRGGRAGRQRRALIVGAGRAGRSIARAIARHSRSQYGLVGFVDDDVAKQRTEIEGLSVLGGREDLLSLIRQNHVSEVILAITHDPSAELVRSLLDARELGVNIRSMPLLYEEINGRVPVEDIHHSWHLALSAAQTPTSRMTAALKRALDLVASLCGLVLFGALLPFLALAIRLDSRGPIFYAQVRVGQGRRPFTVRKLRTMVADAEGTGRAVWASRNDPRVTRVGRWLRRTHLDEFPQLWSILRGEMSLVGPRPERPEIVPELEEKIPLYRLRHAVKPGLAGWAVIHAGYVDSLDAAHLRVEYDLYYIKRQSIWLDLRILLWCVGRVLMLKGQ